MDVKKREDIITKWINKYSDETSYKPKALVIGISGGIDSSVVSALCASTGRKTIVLTMPIKQIKSQHDLSLTHAKWLKDKYKNVEHHLIEMDKIFNSFSKVLNNPWPGSQNFGFSVIYVPTTRNSDSICIVL